METTKKESERHAQFSHLLIRGEWFEPELDLMAHVLKLCSLYGRSTPKSPKEAFALADWLERLAENARADARQPRADGVDLLEAESNKPKVPRKEK